MRDHKGSALKRDQLKEVFQISGILVREFSETVTMFKQLHVPPSSFNN